MSPEQSNSTDSFPGNIEANLVVPSPRTQRLHDSLVCTKITM